MAEGSRSSIYMSSDEVTSQSSFYMGFDETFSRSSIYKGSDETFSESSTFKGSDEVFSGSSIIKGSDETYDTFCVPCQELEKKLLPAYRYCIICEEHLCFNCCSNHRKNKVSRHHKLEDEHTLPQSKVVATESASKTTITSLLSVTKDSIPSEINIRSTDKTSSWITGIALLPDSHIAIIDYKNGKVKLIDTRDCKIVSELNFLFGPLDVTSVLEYTLLAVTIPSANKIQFLTISSQNLSKKSAISVKAECRGIAYNDADKTLIVTFLNPGKVEIISLSGEVKRSIEMDNTGARIFECPFYVALTNDNTSMYVSDVLKCNVSVTFLTLDGTVKSVYKDETLQYPQGLCVDQADRVFVAGDSGSVYQLVPGTDKLQPLLDKTHGISHVPYCLAYCDREDKLYAGMADCDVLKVFQLK